MRRLAALVLPCLVLAGDALARSGTGPGGYAWKDCEETDGPACDYVISAVSDGNTGLCSDEIYSPPGGLGFPFPFYGATFSSFAVSANGVVYLSNQPACCDEANAALTGLEGRPLVAPLWDDWAMDNDDELNIFCPDPGCANSGPITFVESYRLGSGVDGGGVAYRDVEWFDTAHHRPTCSEPATATFGLRLYADGRILFNYADVDLGQPAESDAGIGATIGVSRGFLGEHAQVSFDTASIPYAPYAILFIPPCPAVRCNSITAPSDACEGDVVTFRANVGGGTPPYEVSWDFDGDTVADATGNPVDRALPAGTVTVTASVRDACATPAPATCSMTKVVQVHALPRPIVTPSGSTTFCGADGEIVQLVAEAGFASYAWERDGVPLPGETTRTLVTNLSGAHVVRVVDAFGCEGASDPVVVEAEDCTAGCTPLACDAVDVRPEPACEGQPQTFTALVTGGEGAITVSWDVDGDTVPDATGNPLRRVFPPGTRTITAFVSDSCALPAPQSCTASASASVNVLPSPGITPLGPTSFCAARGESVTLEADAGFASWQWTEGGTDIPGATSQQLLVTTSGLYSVRVTDAAGCSGEALTPVDVVADACPSPCGALTCGAVIVTPARACEGEPQQLLLEVSGGFGTVGVAWDVDGDTLPDAVGNPVDVTPPPGTYRVRAVAADQCADPAPQSCEAFGDVVVDVPASALGEVSGPGEPQLFVTSEAGALEVSSETEALAYHAYVDIIGSWWAPSTMTGRQCAIAPAGAGVRPGTVALATNLPTDSWVVVVAANHCGEGTPGSSSEGVERSSDAGWQACGPVP